MTIQTEDRGSFGWGLSEAESPGKAMDLGGFDVSPATGEAVIGVGTVAAGTTVRVGTYHAWGDLLGAYTIGDTIVTLYELKDGKLVKLAQNDDAGMDPAQVATEDVRGASYVSFTLARSALLEVGVACKSARCRGSLRLKGDIDSNGGLKDVAAAIGRIDSDNETSQRHLLRISGKNDWYAPYQEGSNHKHFQGIQRLRTGDDYQSLDTRGLAVSGSATGELFHVRYPTRYSNPPTLGPLPEYGTSMHRWLYGNNGKTNHFGGIQASGHYLGGGFDGNDGKGLVVGLDMNQISGDMPVKIFEWWPGRNASAVGLAKITGQNAPMVMAIGGPDTSFVRMMRKPPNPWGYTNPARNDIKVSWLPYTLDWPSPSFGDSSPLKWPEGSLDVTTEWPNSLACCMWQNVCEPNSYCGSSRQLFQSLQLVVQSDPVTHAYKRLFLAGAYASDELYAGRLEDGTDELTLFEVYLSESVLRLPASQNMGLVGKHRVPLNGDRRMIFHCTFGGPDNDWRRCSFNASFGLYVDPDHEAVSAFSSRAWASTDGDVDLVEFAPRVVTLPPITDNQVVMCTDHYFMGTCRVLTVTEKFFAHAEFMGSNGQGLTNDWVSSIRVGAKVKLDIFDQSAFRFHAPKGSDWITLLPGDYPTLGSFNDIISSAIVSPLDEDAQHPRAGQVSVCAGKNGTSLCSVLGRGRYPKSEAEASEVDGTGGAFGMYNDWMSSVIVPPGGQVRLFYDTEFGGSNNLYIKNSDVVTKTYNLSDYGWDERVSSVIVL